MARRISQCWSVANNSTVAVRVTNVASVGTGS